jgi:hypothetical protein
MVARMPKKLSKDPSLNAEITKGIKAALSQVLPSSTDGHCFAPSMFY